MNKVCMTGNLVADPKLRHAGERAICTMRIAVDNGSRPTTFIDVATFDGQAYACAEYMEKGRRVGVEGKLALDEWRDAGGKFHQRYSVIGRVEFLDRPPRAEREEDPIGPPADGPEPAVAPRPEPALAV
jgi:single-strand DNA-binding protein